MASNYDSNALQNDGSCLYPETNVSAQILDDLPSELPECSGMVGYENYWIAINDSGGGNDIFLLDRSTGSYIRKIEILDATNVDWESLTIFENNLYIGDTGNNNGNRTNLGVYKISLDELGQDEISSEFFAYKYEDQTDFSPEPEEHPFDCESIIVDENGIHFFTKGWNFGLIGHYLLDISLGNENAVKIDEINLNGLVTGANLDEDGTLGFTGTDGNAFLWLFYDYQPGSFFSGNKRKIGIGFLGQNESLFLDENQTAWITSEDSFQPGKIYFLDYATWIVSSQIDIPSINNFEIFPNPFIDNFSIHWKEKNSARYTLKTLTGVNIMEGLLFEGLNFINSNHSDGFYLLEIYFKGKLSHALVLNQ